MLASSASGLWEKCPAALRRFLLARIFKRSGAIEQTARKPSLFFLPLISWYYAGFQRPHQMARALVELGCAVYYHEPVTPEASDIRPEDERTRATGLDEIRPGLSLVRSPRFAVADVIDVLSIDVVIMSWPAQARWFNEESSAFLVYEMVDDHSLVAGDADSTHDRLIEIADVVVATADALFRSLKPLREDVILLPNAVKLDDWIVLPESDAPGDFTEARRKEVVVGYTGALATWFDWDLLEGMARARPNWAFVLIGFAWDEEGKSRVAKAASLPNVYWLGAKPHSELKHYVSRFDAAIIPFKLNAVTHSCSPLKLFEYMACGKPVICTPMEEASKYKSVRLASSSNEFIAQIEKAIETDNNNAIAARRSEAAANTWIVRAAALLERIQKVRTEQDSQPRRHRLRNRRAQS